MRRAIAGLVVLAGLLWHVEAKAQTCPRVNVTSYYVSSWTQAFNSAIAAQTTSPCGGGAVYVPAGTYPIGGQIYLKSNITIEGDGFSSLLVASNNTLMFDAQGPNASNIAFRNLAFDLNATTNYATVMRIYDGDRITVEGCRFFSTAAIPSGWTVHAVLTDGARGLILNRNQVEQMQFKLSGVTGGPDTIVVGNRWKDVRNFAVSYVSAVASGEVHRIVIADNIVAGITGGSGGFYLGTDGQTFTSGKLQDVIIKGNIISGSVTNAGFIPIIVRGAGPSAPPTPAYSTRRINIKDNVIAVAGATMYGIEVQDHNASGDTGMLLAVQGNQIDGAQNAIRIAGISIHNVSINDNQVNSGSIFLLPSKSGGMRLGTINGNVVKGGFIGVAADSSLSRFRISGNYVDCSNGPNAAFILQTNVSSASIDVDLKGNSLTNCPFYYTQFGTGTYSGLRPPTASPVSD
jgi:hypothetical protein